MCPGQAAVAGKSMGVRAETCTAVPLAAAHWASSGACTGPLAAVRLTQTRTAEHQWIRELEDWLRQAVPAHPQVRFLAICFGAQVMAQALGGRVGKNPDGGLVLKVESVQLSDALRGSAAMQLAAADVAGTHGGGGSGTDGGDGSSGSSSSSGDGGSDGPGSVRIIQSHGDQVLQLPPSCVLLAHSPTAPVEMFSNAAGNLLAVQVRGGLPSSGWCALGMLAWWHCC